MISIPSDMVHRLEGPIGCGKLRNSTQCMQLASSNRYRLSAVPVYDSMPTDPRLVAKKKKNNKETGIFLIFFL